MSKKIEAEAKYILCIKLYEAFEEIINIARNNLQEDNPEILANRLYSEYLSHKDNGRNYVAETVLTNQNVTEKFVNHMTTLFPYLKQSPDGIRSITQNKNLSYKFLKKTFGFTNAELSSNPNLTYKIVKDDPEGWSWEDIFVSIDVKEAVKIMEDKSLGAQQEILNIGYESGAIELIAMNDTINKEIIKKFVVDAGLGDDESIISYLLVNDNVTMKMIDMDGLNWKAYYKTLIQNPNFNFNFYKKHHEFFKNKSDDIIEFSKNLTLQFVLWGFPDLLSSNTLWKKLSRGNVITQSILDHEDYKHKWNYKEMSVNENINDKIVKDNYDKGWDFGKIVMNAKLSSSFLKKIFKDHIDTEEDDVNSISYIGGIFFNPSMFIDDIKDISRLLIEDKMMTNDFGIKNFCKDNSFSVQLKQIIDVLKKRKDTIDELDYCAYNPTHKFCVQRINEFFDDISEEYDFAFPNEDCVIETVIQSIKETSKEYGISNQEAIEMLRVQKDMCVNIMYTFLVAHFS